MTSQGCGIVLFLVAGMAGRNCRKRHEDCIFANQMVKQLTKEDLYYKWEGMTRPCIELWVTVLRIEEDRLLKQVMMEVMELEDGVRWRQDLERSLRMFG